MGVPATGIFLIVVFVLLVIYFLVGSLVRYHNGMRRFPEVLPNYRFWRWVGLLAADGWKFVVSCGKYKPNRGSGAAVLPNKSEAEHMPLPQDLDEVDFVVDEENDEFNQPAVIVRY